LRKLLLLTDELEKSQEENQRFYDESGNSLHKFFGMVRK